MKKIFSALTLVATLGMYSAPASAGFLIEPFISYGVSGEWDVAGVGDDLSGLYYGARLGLTTMGFMYGVEYQMGNIEYAVGTLNIDASNTDMGAFVGFEFPVLVRAYLSYYFVSDSDFDNSSTTLKGSGYKIGVGYTGLPFVAINVEMLNNTYDKAEVSGVEGAITERKNNLIMLGVSVPLP